MGNLTSTLTIALQDDVSSRAGRAASALKQLGASGNDLKRLAAASPEMARLSRELDRLRAASGKIDLFKGASSNLDALGVGLRKARQEVARFDAQIASRKKKLGIVEAIKASEPERYRRDFAAKGITVEALAVRLQGIERKRAAAGKVLDASKAEFMEQGRAVRALGRELTAAGVPLRGLRAAEEGLRASIEGVNREIARQPALFAQAQARAEAQAKASATALRNVVEQARAERAARQAAQASAAASGARANAARPAAAEAARSAVERGRAERRRLREEADLLNGLGAGAADVRKVPELSGAVAARKALTDKAGAIDAFRVDSRGLKEASLAYRQAQQDVRRLKAEMAAAPSDAIAQRLAAAQMTAVRAGEAFRAQGQAARASRLALAEAGLFVDRLRSSEQALAGSIREATAALAGQTKALAANQRAAAERAAGREARDMAFAVAAPVVGGALKGTYEKARDGWVEMDEATRRQRAILGFSEEQQSGLTAQALKIGQDTRFSNPDVVKGQTRIGSSLADHLKDPKVIAAITEQAKNYALAMGTTIDEGSSAILGRMLGLRMDMSTPEAAAGSAKHAANRLVQFAKSSGADHNDVMGYTKFGAAPGSVGGFSEEFADGLAAQLRRIGYEGSMAGNFVRAAATKLAVPTSKGYAALAASGINHSDYVAQGGELSAQNLNAVLKGKFGKSLNDGQMARIHALMQDETVVGNREEFIPQVSAIIQESLARKTKKGEVNAQDAERIAKTVDQYLNASAGAVDIERLMRDVIAKGVTPALGKYLFGQEHGGRAMALDLPTLDKDIASFKNTPDNRAQKVGEDVNAGVYGAYQRFIGSIETLYMQLGKANDALLTKAYDYIGNGIDEVAKLPAGAIQAGTALAGLAGAAVVARGALGAFRLARDLLGLGGAGALVGSAAKLGGSALALDAAAAALTRAAIAQGGGSVAKGAAAGAAGNAAAGAGGAAAGGLGVATGLIVGGGAIGGAILADQMPKAVGGDKSLGDAVNDLAAMRKRIEAEAAANRDVIGYARPGIAVEMPGGAAASDGFPTSTEQSRGVLGDFLFGKDKQTHQLPLPPSMARPDARRLDPSARAGLADPSAVDAATVARLAAEARADREAGRRSPLLTTGPADAAATARLGAQARADREAGRRSPLLTTGPSDGAAMARLGAAERSGREAGQRSPLLDTGAADTALRGIEERVRSLSGETIAPNVDASGLSGLDTAAEATQGKLSALDGTTVAPKGDPSGLQAIEATVDRLISKLSQLGASIASAKSAAASVAVPSAGAPTQQASSGVVRRTMANNFA